MILEGSILKQSTQQEKKPLVLHQIGIDAFNSSFFNLFFSF
jgi:hypothetical protein